jgi:hypothetical protein
MGLHFYDDVFSYLDVVRRVNLVLDTFDNRSKCSIMMETIKYPQVFALK